MKKTWAILAGVLTFGLAYPAAHSVVKGHQKEVGNNTESDRTRKVLLLTVILIILLLAFSVEIKTILNKLF